MKGMQSEGEVRSRQGEVARCLLHLQQTGQEGTYEFEQCRHWLYCLDWVLGKERRPEEEYWQWVMRLAEG